MRFLQILSKITSWNKKVTNQDTPQNTLCFLALGISSRKLCSEQLQEIHKKTAMNIGIHHSFYKFP